MDIVTILFVSCFVIMGLIFFEWFRSIVGALLKKLPTLLMAIWAIVKTGLHTILMDFQNVIRNFKPRSAVFFELDRRRTSEDALG